MSSASLKAKNGSIRHLRCYRSPGVRMAHVQRLIAFALLAFASLSAQALIPTNATWNWNAGVYGDPGKVGTGRATAQLACDGYVTQQRTATPGWQFQDGTLGAAPSPPSTYGLFKCTSYARSGTSGAYNIGPLEAAITQNAGGSCPANSTASGTQCACTAPYVENAGKTACEAPNPCASLAGKDAGDISWNGGPVSASPIRPDYTYCDGWQQLGNGKCTATARRDASFGVDGNWINQGRATYTGNLSSGTCNGDGGTGTTPTDNVKPPGTDPIPPVKPPEGQAAPSPCPQGQTPGDVNGQRVCATRGPETPVQANDSREVKNPDGSSTTTNGTTTCKDGKCTRDETVCTKANAGATPSCSGTTSTTTSQGTFCEANKGSKVCESSDGDGSFSGTCVAGFKAESEDPVIAAMALEQHKRNCELFVKTTPESDLYNVEKVKTGNQTGNLPGNSDVAIGSSSFDTSDAIGGGACWSDKHFTIKGYDFNMKLSSICPYASQLGNLLVAIAFLTAAGIVYRGSNT